MSNQSSDNTKRIAKNTLLLYFRMLFMMVVSLYTSRVILNALGVEYFGIYNVVGEVVTIQLLLSLIIVVQLQSSTVTVDKRFLCKNGSREMAVGETYSLRPYKFNELCLKYQVFR